MDLVVPISKELVEHGFKIGVKVYRDKLNFRDKTKWGGSNELQADVYGFIAEAIVCDYFKQPLPELTKQTNDEFDMVLDGQKIDIKKVGFNKRNYTPRISINKRQFERKKDKIDSFLFCTFKGGFESKKVLIETTKGNVKVKQGLDVWIPIAGTCKLWLIGWIKSVDVEGVARQLFLKDNEGNVVDELIRIDERNLNDIKELIK